MYLKTFLIGFTVYMKQDFRLMQPLFSPEQNRCLRFRGTESPRCKKEWGSDLDYEKFRDRVGDGEESICISDTFIRVTSFFPNPVRE